MADDPRAVLHHLADELTERDCSLLALAGYILDLESMDPDASRELLYDLRRKACRVRVEACDPSLS